MFQLVAPTPNEIFLLLPLAYGFLLKCSFTSFAFAYIHFIPCCKCIKYMDNKINNYTYEIWPDSSNSLPYFSSFFLNTYAWRSWLLNLRIVTCVLCYLWKPRDNFLMEYQRWVWLRIDSARVTGHSMQHLACNSSPREYH